MGGLVYRESDGTAPGSEPVVAELAGLPIGLTVCYDLRFPELYRELTQRLGDPVYRRVDARATPQQKDLLKRLAPEDIRTRQLAGEPIVGVVSHAAGNGAAIGGIKVEAANGWFAARPSGTEDTYKIYAESFLGTDHLERIIGQAQTLVSEAFSARIG